MLWRKLSSKTSETWLSYRRPNAEASVRQSTAFLRGVSRAINGLGRSFRTIYAYGQAVNTPQYWKEAEMSSLTWALMYFSVRIRRPCSLIVVLKSHRRLHVISNYTIRSVADGRFR
ncbi:uncharacterized protein EKO05_0006984 [Ascochyta rabiei]|uniref:uncharacterized protein n=1 Tax=Didymella rabiei TaxID=5454 RepID=UPI0021FA7ABD|nr:uncharacterized protein EKO05_0006984 [Ascochyta rabiei]UPX16593.1 hypothetical protein EKO05_0006984 [Ascochyta rabiei]